MSEKKVQGLLLGHAECAKPCPPQRVCRPKQRQAHAGFARLGKRLFVRGILAEAVEAGRLPLERVEARLGAPTALLLHDVLRVRELPGRADLFDDASAGALRDLALSVYDVRTESHCD